MSSSMASVGAIPVASGKASSDTQVVVGLFTRHKKAFLTFAASAILILMGLGYGAYRWLSPGSGFTIESLAVLPFTNGGGDANTDYLSDGITESLIDNLAHVPQLKVKSRNSVFRYKGKDVDVHKVGNDLGVPALVIGRVVPRGDSIEVSAELTDVRDNTEIWGQHYSGKSADIISLQQQIAGDIAEKLRSIKASWAKPTGTPTRRRATVSTIVLIFMSLLDWETDCGPDYADHSSTSWRTRQLATRRPQSYPSRLKSLRDSHLTKSEGVYTQNPDCECIRDVTPGIRQA
jgi:TolB-like protein